MALDLGSSQSTTKTSDDHSQIGASDQGTAIQIKGAGNKLVGSTLIKLGKGSTYSVTNAGLDAATLGNLLGQANIATSERKSSVTGLPIASAPENPIFKGSNLLLAGAGVVVVALLSLLLKRR